MRINRKTFVTTALLAPAMLVSGVADAAIVQFTATRENTNPSSVPGSGRCAPTYFSTAIITPGNLSSTGVSNFGAFTSTQSHCNVSAGFPTAIVDGEFTYDFAQGDSLTGTYTGQLALSATPGVIASLHNLIVTGGTGRFLGATGTLTNLGTLRAGTVNGIRVGIFEGTVEGRLNAPAIPEPATWAMMIAGFGLVGATARRRMRIACA